jgi:hypothetical protein
MFDFRRPKPQPNRLHTRAVFLKNPEMLKFKYLFIYLKLKTMDTYYLQKKADSITAKANALEHSLQRVIKLSNMVGIKPSQPTIKELQAGNPNSINDSIRIEFRKMEDEAVMIRLKGTSDKYLIAKYQNLIDLQSDVKYMTENALPAYLWDGTRIANNELRKHLHSVCTVQLTKQNEEDISLIENVAKALPRFIPVDFIDGNRVDIESYLEFLNY